MDRIETLKRMVEKNPDDELAGFLLGKECIHAKRYPEAIEALEKCISAKADYTAAYRTLGDAYRLAGDLLKAATVYEKGIEVATLTGDLQAGKEMQVFLKKIEKGRG